MREWFEQLPPYDVIFAICYCWTLVLALLILMLGYADFSEHIFDGAFVIGGLYMFFRLFSFLSK